MRRIVSLDLKIHIDRATAALADGVIGGLARHGIELELHLPRRVRTTNDPLLLRQLARKSDPAANSERGRCVTSKLVSPRIPEHFVPRVCLKYFHPLLLLVSFTGCTADPGEIDGFGSASPSATSAADATDPSSESGSDSLSTSGDGDGDDTVTASAGDGDGATSATGSASATATAGDGDGDTLKLSTKSCSILVREPQLSADRSSLDTALRVCS